MASTASWANVSALDSSVGRPSTPLSAARRFLPVGSAILPFTALTRAPPSPETNRSGTSTTRTIFLRSGSARARSDEHPSELQSLRHLVCRLLLDKKNHHILIQPHRHRPLRRTLNHHHPDPA